MCRKGINITEYTFSKRYDDIRSLTRYISGCSYIMPFPTLIMHVSNKRTFIIYILHFMFPYGISFFLIAPFSFESADFRESLFPSSDL